MHRRGKIRKRTVPVELAAATASPGDAILAPAPIGDITSVEGSLALARVRVDRLATAERDGQTPLLHETPVTIRKPDWLVSEQTAINEA